MYIHITQAGIDAGFDPATINRALERHARECRARTITLPDTEYRVLRDGVTPPDVPALDDVQVLS